MGKNQYVNAGKKERKKAEIISSGFFLFAFVIPAFVAFCQGGCWDIVGAV